MPDLHPIVEAIVDGVAVVKGDVRGYEKERNRVRVANAQEVRDTDFSGQFGGLYVRTLQAQFDLDTGDTTTADDGVNTIIDGEGNRFKRVAVSFSETQIVVTDAGDVELEADAEDVIIIDKTVGAATTVTLPSAADRTTAIRIVDGKGDAATNNITIVPQSGESIWATVDYPLIIDRNGGSERLTPRADGTGWF